MSNSLFSHNTYTSQPRISHSRGAYGRPKTRSPFPSKTFVLDIPTSIGLFPKLMYVDGKSLQRNPQVKRPTHYATYKRPGPVRAGNQDSAQNPILKLVKHQRFSSITQKEGENSVKPQSTPQIEQPNKSDSLDIESSYKLTFYHPKSEQKVSNKPKEELRRPDRNDAYRQMLSQ